MRKKAGISGANSKAPLLAKGARNGAPADLFLRHWGEREPSVSGSCRGGADLGSGGHTGTHGNGYRNCIGNERDDGAENHDQYANPYPGDQRVQVRLDDGAAGFGVLSLINNIEVFFQRGADGRDVLLLLAGIEEAALGIERVDLAAILEDVNDGDVGAVVGILFLGVGAADEGVGADGQLIAE